MIPLAAGAFLILFGLSLFGKLDDWRAWSGAVSSWVLSPRLQFLRLAAQWGIPAAEGIVCVSLIVFPRVGLIEAGSFLFLLAAGVLLLMRRNADADCGCFGSLANSKLSIALVIRNATLGGLAVLAQLVENAGKVQHLQLPYLAFLAELGVLSVLIIEYRRFRRIPRHVVQGMGR